MYQDEYQAKKGTVYDALAYIQSGDYISIGYHGNEPITFMRELHTIADRVQDVKVWTSIQLEDYPYATDINLIGKIDMISIFYGAQHRKMAGSRHTDFMPTDLHNSTQTMLLRGKPRVFVCTVSPMDENGYFYHSSLFNEGEMLQIAEVVILEVNPNQPRTFGQAKIHISQVTCLYEVNHELAYAKEHPILEIDQQIAGYVASLIHNGDTLQFGLGGVPECVGEALYNHKDMGIHTELLSNALCSLIEKGIVNNSRKTLHPGKSVCGFIWGNPHLYKSLDGYEDLAIMPASYVNKPYIIAQNDKMVSVNAALEVDLTGQICSESVGSRQYSGTGGAYDFACGAHESRGGRSIIALRSTAKNDSVSKIKFQLTPGAAVSITRNVVDYVVTEYGIAELRGATLRERAQRLIAIAHPNFRKELTQQAHDLLL